jgi:hypothetical protein
MHQDSQDPHNKKSTAKIMWKPVSQTSNSYMPEEILPPERNREANSTHRLSRLELQRAMTDIKRFVESRLESDLNLVKVCKESTSNQPQAEPVQGDQLL